MARSADPLEPLCAMTADEINPAAPTPPADGDLDALLGRLTEDTRNGAGRADPMLLEMVYDHLRTIARRIMRSERNDHTLQPTALANEAWLRLTAGRERSYTDREHFFCAAALAMRRILLDHARGRLANRRQADPAAVRRMEESLIVRDEAEEILALDQALNRLGDLDPRLARIVELRCFCDLSVKETGAALGLSPTTVKREWQIARTLLLRELGG
jgi:RNA polymerase sigma factor (TIGR02999 family)